MAPLPAPQEKTRPQPRGNADPPAAATRQPTKPTGRCRTGPPRRDVDGVLVAEALRVADAYEQVADRLDAHARSMRSIRAAINGGRLRGYQNIADSVLRVLQAASIHDRAVRTDATEELLASSAAFDEWCRARAARARRYRTLARARRKAALEYATGLFGDRAMTNRLDRYEIGRR